MATSSPARFDIRPQPAFADILRDREEYAHGPEQDRMSQQMNGWFDRLMLQSGTELSPSMALALCLCAAIALGGAAFVWQENFLTTAIASAIGAIIPLITLVIIRSRRQSKITEQLPGMVDELARAAKTGRSLEQCLELVMHDTPAPLGEELRYCVQKMELGLSTPESLRELPHRTGVVSPQYSSHGSRRASSDRGDLVAVLDRLARTIRDRISFLGRLQAATAASRARPS
ncbi:MAG: type II secretion system F family protein [Planctomycetales bacterium]